MDLDSPDGDLAAGTDAKEDFYDYNGMQVLDDQSGEKLVPELVRKARLESVKLTKHECLCKVPMSDSMANKGRKPIWGYAG